MRFAEGTGDLSGRTVALQGVGNVGGHIARLLHERGAKLVVTDIDDDALGAVARDTAADVVGLDEIYDIDADIFAPCALGGSLSESTVARLRVKVVAGCANNQLAEPEDGERLAAAGVVYAPDYVVNSGGMLSGAAPILGLGHDEAELRRRLDKIDDRVFARARSRICSP